MMQCGCVLVVCLCPLSFFCFLLLDVNFGCTMIMVWIMCWVMCLGYVFGLCVWVTIVGCRYTRFGGVVQHIERSNVEKSRHRPRSGRRKQQVVYRGRAIGQWLPRLLTVSVNAGIGLNNIDLIGWITSIWSVNNIDLIGSNPSLDWVASRCHRWLVLKSLLY